MDSDTGASRFTGPDTQAIVDALPAMIAYWRRDLICLHANDSYLAWFGRARQEVVGHHIREVIGEGPFSLNWPYLCGVLDGNPQFFERQLTKPNGEIAIATANYIPDFDADRKVRGFYVLVEDITPLRRAEQKLRQSEAELRVLLSESREALAWQSLAEQVAHVGHWRVNLLDRALVWSPEVFRIHGLNPDDYAPDIETAINFYHPDDRQFVADLIGQSLKPGQEFEFDARIVRRDGCIRNVRSRGMVTPDDMGRPKSVFGVFMDLTDQIETERALRAANEQLQTLIHHDALTGLSNRRRFDSLLDQAWADAKFAGTPLSLVMLDVDFFKVFNDCYGHQAGDDCLRAVGAAIAAIPLSLGAEAARYGGEEFAVLLPGADEALALTFAEQVRGTIEALGLRHSGNPDHGQLVTASLGVATAWPGTGGTVDDLVKTSDMRLYEAKRQGRNRVVSQSEQTILASAGGEVRV